MYKEDLALNNQQEMICHKKQPNQIIYIYYIPAVAVHSNQKS